MLLNPAAQKGVILVVALVMLLAMTLIGVTVMSGSITQEKMAGNSRQLTTARLAAESALRRGEEAVADMSITDADSLQTFYASTTLSSEFYNALDVNFSYVTKVIAFDYTDGSLWTDANSKAVTGLDTGLTKKPPRYVIEYIGRFIPSGKEVLSISLDSEEKDKAENPPFVFRVTSIGYGASDNIYSVLQSTYITQQGSF